MRKLKFIAAVAAALALAAFVLVGCSSGSGSASSASASGSSASSASASASSASASASSASASASASSASAGAVKKLIVGFDAGFKPYGYQDEATGEYTGFDLELAKAVCDANGWEFEAEPIDWDAKDALLNSGAINCIWNGFTIEGREGQYAFTDPYMLNEQVVVVKADSSVNSISDLEGKNVMTQVDSAALELLETPEAEGGFAEAAAKFNGGAPQTVDTFMNAYMQLESGMVDAVVGDSAIFANQNAKKPGVFKTIQTLSSEHYGVGFATSDTELAETVNTTLKALYADGTVKALCDKYAEEGISFENWVLV